MADPWDTVERVFDFSEQPLDDSVRGAIRTHLAANPRGKHGRIVYDLKADFGVDPAAVRERFAFYYDRFPVVVGN